MKNLLIATMLFSSTYAYSQSLLLPDLVVAKSNLYDWKIDTRTIPGRVLLRFSNGVANIGKGKMEIRGGEIVNGRQIAYQRIYYSDGRYITRRAGTNVYHPSHHHTHFSDFASYHLHEVDNSGGLGDQIRASEKVSFCLIDEFVFNSHLSNFKNRKNYTACGNTYQGISVGWKDVYAKEIPDQWIDITGIDSGEYWLESTVDPFNKLRESNNSNNSDKIKISIDMPIVETEMALRD